MTTDVIAIEPADLIAVEPDLIAVEPATPAGGAPPRHAPPLSLGAAAARIGAEVAGPFAADVDAAARFPRESIAALRSEGMLVTLVPEAAGGGGRRVIEVAEATTALARHCASTAMVFAMHQLQIACLVRHGSSEALREYLEAVTSEDLLLASATTEEGVGGDLQSSICGVERSGGRYRLRKRSPVVSYGEHADGVLATARSTTESPPSDQVLVVCAPPGLKLEPTSDWNAFGLRGTCSRGFELLGEGDEGLVFPEPFAIIATTTMVPVAHILWSSVWLGIAGSAAEKARRFVQAGARKRPGTAHPAAGRLAELEAVHQQMKALVAAAASRYQELEADPDSLSAFSFMTMINALKISASALVADIVAKALLICGMAGYVNDSPYSLSRLLRDAHGAAVMVSNERLLADNAQMLLVSKES